MAQMSGGTETHAWGTEPLWQLEGSALEWSMVREVDGRVKNRKKDKTCAFCGKMYSGGPDKIRIHLDEKVKPREIAVCKPTAHSRERHSLVVTKMRKRERVAAKRKQDEVKKEDEHALRRAAAGMGMVAFGGGGAQASVDKHALPLDLFDDVDFRAAIATTAKCGTKLTAGAQGGVHLPKRKTVTTKILPQFDADLDEKIKARMGVVASRCGVTLMSDGWTSVSNRPIVNALASTPVGSYFIKAIDASGKTKDAKFIGNFMM
eukprot:scaffold107829_cov22-Tisochrysis_lutea.AAC.1